MNILFISLLDPSESGSGNQKVTLLSAKYLSSVGIHCFIAYFKDSEYEIPWSSCCGIKSENYISFA